MRIVVLDASVAVKWYVREQGSDQAVQLLDREDLHFVAPDLFRAEIANALLRQNRSGQLSEAALDSALADLTFTMPELVPSAEIIDRAVVLARILAHPVYDCLYLSLAERRDTVLVTADEEFVSRCRVKLSGQDGIAQRLRFLHEFET